MTIVNDGGGVGDVGTLVCVGRRTQVEDDLFVIFVEIVVDHGDGERLAHAPFGDRDRAGRNPEILGTAGIGAAIDGERDGHIATRLRRQAESDGS